MPDSTECQFNIAATGTLPKSKQSRRYPYLCLFIVRAWIADQTFDHRIERRHIRRFESFGEKEIIQLQSTSPTQSKSPD